jgi:hypothetical protein
MLERAPRRPLAVAVPWRWIIALRRMTGADVLATDGYGLPAWL